MRERQKEREREKERDRERKREKEREGEREGGGEKGMDKERGIEKETERGERERERGKCRGIKLLIACARGFWHDCADPEHPTDTDSPAQPSNAHESLLAGNEWWSRILSF